jgi:coenzyme F420 biosynthesis associated uncharacterized protein
MIDWGLAGTVAHGIAALAPAPDATQMEAVAEPSRESERLVSEYTGLVASSPLPLPEAVGRQGWIEANHASMATVLDPVAEKLRARTGPFGAPLAAGAGVVLGLEVGALSGFLAQRVLGQYEFAVLEPERPARLLYVAPNLAHSAETLRVDGDELLRWVALHETTHALQFAGVPWLRPHLAEMVRALLASADVNPAALLRLPEARDLRALLDSIREGGLTALMVDPGQRALLERMQAFMAVLEGYAEHVMDAVGAQVLPDLDRLRTALDKRRRDRTGLLRLVERLLGMELKLRQYEQGKRFCDAVVERAGIQGLNRVWEDPERLPDQREVADPGAWLARVGAA